MLSATQSVEETVGYRDLLSDILSQAITGELVGMLNFSTLAGIIDDPHEMMEAVEHSNSERGHAECFLELAKSHGLDVRINLQGTYWNSIRSAFLSWASKRDFIACLLIQEVMLESFAVGMYSDIGEAISGPIGSAFRAIAAEEGEHLSHSIEILQAELNRDPTAFIAKVEAVHLDCMTILAAWSAKSDLHGHCGVCKGNCMKEALPLAHLDIVHLRGRSLNLYMKTLDKIGLPGEQTLRWIANLPA